MGEVNFSQFHWQLSAHQSRLTPGGSWSSGAEEGASGHLLPCIFNFLLHAGCHWDAGLLPLGFTKNLLQAVLPAWCCFLLPLLCLSDSLFFQTSTAGLLHISVFLALTLPALLVTTIPNPFEKFVPNWSQMWNRCGQARCLQLLLGWNSVETLWAALVIFAHTGESRLDIEANS